MFTSLFDEGDPQAAPEEDGGEDQEDGDEAEEDDAQKDEVKHAQTTLRGKVRATQRRN